MVSTVLLLHFLRTYHGKIMQTHCNSTEKLENRTIYKMKHVMKKKYNSSYNYSQICKINLDRIKINNGYELIIIFLI